jgi:hypothetical protein
VIVLFPDPPLRLPITVIMHSSPVFQLPLHQLHSPQ